jgi:2-C-methyl-D-erythritol 4-phosphate cytidylyltransferase
LGASTLLGRTFDVLKGADCRPITVVVDADRVSEAFDLVGHGDVVGAEDGYRTTMISLLSSYPGTDYVVIHEHEYPLATVGQVRALIDAVESHDAAVMAVPVMDTLKQVESGAIVATIDRSNLWHLQHPQAFRVDTLLGAHRRASEDGLDDMDNVAVMLRYGARITVVPGASTNVKITTAEDLLLAEALVRSK